jgi:hypothetical protein
MIAYRRLPSEPFIAEVFDARKSSESYKQLTISVHDLDVSLLFYFWPSLLPFRLRLVRVQCGGFYTPEDTTVTSSGCMARMTHTTFDINCDATNCASVTAASVHQCGCHVFLFASSLI